MKFPIITGILIAFAVQVSAQTYCTKENKALCEKTLTEFDAQNWEDQPISAVAMNVGKHFLGIPYVAKTLEIEGDEQLVVELSGLDCTTFLENVVVFSRLIKKENLSFEDFTKELEYLRYREGENDGYPSRLHYFTDWIYTNAEKGIIKDITKEVGGVAYPNKLNFMSTHPKAYHQLSNNQAFVASIAEAEKAISQREYHYIPKASVAKHEGNIHSGDLIAITTGISGLDIVHVGFAYKKNGRVHLFHASTGSNKVEISTKPLAEYLVGKRSQTGIMVCRLNEVE